jgi:uncharacterized protein YkwD
MRTILMWALAICLANAAGSLQAQTTQPAGLDSATLNHPESAAYDSEAERQLFNLANLARAEAQVPPLRLDPGLTRAARRHASVMAEHRQISHQFPGEPSPAERIAATCSLHLDETAENVAVAEGVLDAHEGFMLSPMHRANLLRPSYNVVGTGVARRGATLYVVQDFGRELPIFSVTEATKLLAQAIAQTRHQAKLPPLEQRAHDGEQAEACHLAQIDSVQVRRSQSRPISRLVLHYTSMLPDALPAPAVKAVRDGSLHAFAAAACFARSPSYPGGAYWVVVVLY